MAAPLPLPLLPALLLLLLAAAPGPPGPAGALPLVDPGLFVILGVQTCREGSGYCLLGSDCTLDEDFLPDDRGGHCDGLRSAFTPSAHFVCCRYSAEDNSTAAARTEAAVGDDRDQQTATEPPGGTATTPGTGAGTTEEQVHDLTTWAPSDADPLTGDVTTFFPPSGDGDETTTEDEPSSTTADPVTSYETVVQTAQGTTLTSSAVKKTATVSPDSRPPTTVSATEPTGVATASTPGSTERTTPAQSSTKPATTGVTTTTARSTTTTISAARNTTESTPTEPAAKVPPATANPTKAKPGKVQSSAGPLKRMRVDPETGPGATPHPSSVTPVVSAPAQVSARGPAPALATAAPPPPPQLQPAAEVTSPSRVSASDSTSTLNNLVTPKIDASSAATASEPTARPSSTTASGNSLRPEVTSPSRVSASDATSVSPRSTAASSQSPASSAPDGGGATGQDVLDLLTEGEWQINEVPDEEEAAPARRGPPGSSTRAPSSLQTSPSPSPEQESGAETRTPSSAPEYAGEASTEINTPTSGSETTAGVEQGATSTDSNTQEVTGVTDSNTELWTTVTNTDIESTTVITESEDNDAEDVQLRTLPPEPSEAHGTTAGPTTSTTSIERTTSTPSSLTTPSNQTSPSDETSPSIPLSQSIPSSTPSTSPAPPASSQTTPSSTAALDGAEGLCGEYPNGTRAAGAAPPPTDCWLRQFVDVRTNEFVCHGAMVGRGMVATSAVCAISLHRLGRRRVRLRAAGDGPREPPRRVAQIIVHESFRAADPERGPRHDLGLVRVVASPQQLAQQQLLGRAACAACVAPSPPAAGPGPGCYAFAEDDGDNTRLQCRDLTADGDLLTATCSRSGEAPSKVRSGTPLVCGGALAGVASSGRDSASVFTSSAELRPWLGWNLQRLRT